MAKYGPDVEYVQANLIFGIKHYELDQSQHRFKARIVGDHVRDIYGRLVEEDQLHGRPIALEGSRALDCDAGLQPDGDCQTADADGAYLQARLKGRPEGYLFAERISHTSRAGNAMSSSSFVHGHLRAHTFKQRLGRSC